MNDGAAHTGNKVILRLSQRLARKIKAGELDEMALNDDPCADWSCRLFMADRTQYIIMTNTMSLYSCVMYGTAVTNRDLFVGKMLDAIGEYMTADQQPHVVQRLVAPATTGVSFAKSLNRSVIGSVSDHVHGAKLYLSDGLDLQKIGLRLNETPLSALTGSDGRKYARPREVFVNLVNNAQR